jgi:putative hemolysin
VCRGGLDDVVGVIHLPRLLALREEGASGTIGQHALPASFVPETLTGMELLEQFRARATRMAFVVDEYGVVQGLLTPLDLLEAITGELSPERPVDAWATPQERRLLAGGRRHAGGRAQGAAGHRRAARRRQGAATTPWPA